MTSLQTQVRSFAEAVAWRAGRTPDSELVRRPGEKGWSAAEILSAAHRVAGSLQRVAGAGDAVATAIDPGPEAVVVTTALSLMGAMEVPVPPGAAADWVQSLARRSRWRSVIVSAHRLTTDPVLAVTAPQGPLGLVVCDGYGLCPSLTELADGRTPRALPEPSLSSPSVALTTSGTTGRSKAAVLPNGAGLGQAERVRAAMAYGPGDVLLSLFGWQHVNARHAAFLPAVLSGARIVLGQSFSASRFWDLARSEEVTAFNFMGAVCAMLLRQPPNEADRSHRVSRAYGGPAPAWMYEEMGRRFGVRLQQAYACTELGDIATTSATEVRPGAAGKISSDYEVRLDGADFAGAAGEVLVRPRRSHLTFSEYLGDPKATSAAWSDGWFRTGDRARLEAGWLFYEGRSADVIRRRGINISAEEVEQVIAGMPGVAEAAAVGVPSELTEDEVLAVVVPAPGHEVSPLAVRGFCAGRLPEHSWPRFISIEDDLPRNNAMKLLRAPLRDRGVPHGAWDAEETS